MKIQYLLLCLFFGLFQVNAQDAETSPVLINEIGVMPFNNSKYLELIVSGDPDDPAASVNLENWIIDNNSNADSGDSLYFVLGSCFSNMTPGTMILLYDANSPHPQINTSNDGLPNSAGIFQLAFSNQCISQCVMDADYNCLGNSGLPSLNTGISNFSSFGCDAGKGT